ncbi:MAG: ABC transporter permease [Actinoplanes sp.]
MSAVWRAARAAVRRRRIQTIVIGVVVGLSTTMAVVALGLLAVASGPFDQAYAQQKGAHVIATFAADKVTPAQLTSAAQPAQTAAGPFRQADIELHLGNDDGPDLPLVVVGRDRPDGPVDRLNVWQGRWATAPGEIVLSANPVEKRGPFALGLGTVGQVPGGPRLTVVGFAASVSESAQAWVTPAQATALRPGALQMLYRFSNAATAADVRTGMATVTAGLPAEALTGSRSYLAIKADVTEEPATLLPFLAVFGILGLAVAILIVANVVSGAVVAGFKHIGVLKALGFTPNQVLGIYLTMVSVPAIAGCVVGTVLGNLLATPLLNENFAIYGAGGIGVAPWVDAVALLGMPAIVALSAFVPALRARGLSATEAISAGSSQRTGRGLRIQRSLSGSRLPRSVSLGLGLPFARPARSAMTMAAIILGVLSVTFATGLAASMSTYGKAVNQAGAVQVEAQATDGALSDQQDEAMLRSLPGARRVTPSTSLFMRQSGTSEPVQVQFYRGSITDAGYEMLRGHRPDGPGEVAVSKRFLSEHGLEIGDEFLLEQARGLRPVGQQINVEAAPTRVRISGEILIATSRTIFSNWATLEQAAPGTRADTYEIGLTPGTTPAAYIAAMRSGDPGLESVPADESDEFLAVILISGTLLTLMLGTVAALGVFNTVVLNTRERRRDLGMLKSIGTTPRQVTAMMVTSMAALGALSGLIGIPAGIAAHHLIVPVMANAGQVTFPARMLNVFPAPLLALLALAGIAIAALGALIPARSAARATIAEVLHNE